MTVIPCLNFEENPHAELNVYSFLFCFYYTLSPRYLFAFRNISLFFFFSPARPKGGPCSLRVEFCSSLVCLCFIGPRLHQESLNSGVVNYTGSLVHVMLRTSQGLLSVRSCRLFTVKSLSSSPKPGSSYPSMRFTVSPPLKQNTSAPRD